MYLERLSHGVHTFSQSPRGWFAVAFIAGWQEVAAAAAFLHKKATFTGLIWSSRLPIWDISKEQNRSKETTHRTFRAQARSFFVTETASTDIQLLPFPGLKSRFPEPGILGENTQTTKPWFLKPVQLYRCDSHLHGQIHQFFGDRLVSSL